MEEVPCPNLINRVVPREKLMDKALELVNKIAKSPPLAVELAKRSFYTAADM